MVMTTTTRPDPARLLAPAALIAAVLTCAVPAWAQSIAPILQSYYPQLSHEDVERMEAAAARLYTGTGIGTVERWRNPTSGDSGSVKLVGTSEMKGQPCRRLEYTVRLEKTNQQLNTYTLNWCRTAGDEWKIVEQPIKN